MTQNSNLIGGDKYFSFLVNYIPLVNREGGHYREISDRGLRFPRSDRTDEGNKLFIIWPF